MSLQSPQLFSSRESTPLLEACKKQAEETLSRAHRIMSLDFSRLREFPDVLQSLISLYGYPAEETFETMSAETRKHITEFLFAPSVYLDGKSAIEVLGAHEVDPQMVDRLRQWLAALKGDVYL